MEVDSDSDLTRDYFGAAAPEQRAPGLSGDTVTGADVTNFIVNI